MKKMIFLLLVTVAQAALAHNDPNDANDPNSLKLLRDGAAVAGASVTVTHQIEQGRWLCRFDSPVADDKNRIEVGQSLEILPSSALERMADTMNQQPDAQFRMWGNITTFKKVNYVYPLYFLAVRSAPQPIADANKPADDVNSPLAADANDVVVIPQEVIEKLKPKRTIDLQKLVQGTVQITNEDAVFTEQSGFIKQDVAGNQIFVPDGLGKNIQKISFKLLPNISLDMALKVQASDPDRIRFKCTGVLTKFKDKYYILLSRASRQFSHGNFAR